MIRRCRDERGQLTLLIIGFTAIVLLLLAVVTDVSKAFLVRRDLAQLADGAALAGTRGISGTVVAGSVAGGIELSQESAEREVWSYLDSVGQGGYDNLDWTVTVDGAEVSVHLRAVVDLPLVIPGTSGTATVSADGSSFLRAG
jgi:Putative Flp pilus-assembly TadE/G-like